MTPHLPLLLALVSSAPPAVFSADEALDLPLVVATLTKTQLVVNQRDIADSLVRALTAEYPGAAPRHVVDGAVEDCRLEASCLADARAMAPSAPRIDSGVMLVVEMTRREATLFMTVRLFDTEAIMRARSQGVSTDEIQLNTVLCMGPKTTVADVASLDRAMRDALSPCLAQLRARIEPRMAASLVLRGVPPDAAVSLDGRTLGLVASSSVVVVSALQPGLRQLEIQAERHLPYRATIDVRAPETTLDVELAREPRSPVALIAGVTSVAAGAAILVIAASANSDYLRLCVSSPCEDFDGTSVRSGGVDPVKGPEGVPLVPIGLAALAAGLVWGGGDLVFAEEGLPIYTVLAGLVAGGLVAAVGLGVN